MFRRSLAVAIISVSVTVLSFAPASPASATTPKTALIYGDSLTYESRFQIASRFALKTGWIPHVHAFGGLAPCNWASWVDADLAAYQPSIVGMLTAGNSGGLSGIGSSCMVDGNGVPLAMGSGAYYAKYQTDLATILAKVTATGARVVFFAAPPFSDPVRTTITKQLTVIATNLAYQYHGVSISSTVRSALGLAYTDTKPCLATETPEMGCNVTTGRIPIRTLPGHVDSGLHLCPAGLVAGTAGVCSTYSSGEFRFARAEVNALVAPPPPKLP